MNYPFEYHTLLWKENLAGLSGRVLVNIDRTGEPRLDIYNYEGSEISAYHLYTVLNLTLAEGWLENLERWHRNRRNKWKTEVVVSSDNVSDDEKEYRLYTFGQSEAACSSLIAVSDQRIRTFSVLAEDAAPLLKKIIEDFSPAFLPGGRSSYRESRRIPAFYYLKAPRLWFPELPILLKEQRERVKTRTAFNSSDSAGALRKALAAGQTSGLLETIEALKCLEVLQA